MFLIERSKFTVIMVYIHTYCAYGKQLKCYTGQYHRKHGFLCNICNILGTKRGKMLHSQNTEMLQIRHENKTRDLCLICLIYRTKWEK